MQKIKHELNFNYSNVYNIFKLCFKYAHYMVMCTLKQMLIRSTVLKTREIACYEIYLSSKGNIAELGLLQLPCTTSIMQNMQQQLLSIL